MSGNQFIPNFKQPINNQVNEKVDQTETKKDSMSSFLYKLSGYVVLSLFAILPIFFMPGLWASLGFDKVILAIVTTSVVAVLSCFMALRKSRIKTVLPISICLFWLLVIVSFISAFLSGDTLDSLRGSAFEVQTAGFLAVLAFVMTGSLVLQNSKIMTLKAIVLFTLSATVILLYSLLRVIFGADFLPLGSFSVVTVSPIGDFNDLGILSGMMIVFGLITLALLPLQNLIKGIISGIVVISLVLLAVINFLNIWVVVGFFALLMLAYILMRDSLFQDSSALVDRESSRVLIGVVTLVCTVSAVFVVAGDFAGNKISKIVQIDYAQVAPSVEGTIGIARQVYEQDALLGVGPNRFADAWRLYKDPAINQTVFWDTDFNTGSGFVPTVFINLGLIGGGLMVVFHLFFLCLGFRILSRNKVQDSYWYYVGAVSFASSTFIWGMSYVYEPGATILLIGALFTGLTFVSAGALLPKVVRNIPLVTNRQRGFFIMAVVIIVISNIIVMLLSVSKQYVAERQFSKSQATAESVEDFEQVASDSYLLYPNDRFASVRAQIQLAKLNTLLNLPNPTEEDQQRFLSAVEQAQIFIDQALSQDQTNPDNHAVLAGIYSGLAVAGINGAEERALSALQEAEELDPQNPGYHLVAAQMLARTGDIESAKNKITEALSLKSNYTEALFLSAQLDIRDGNTESAIATTRSIITLEPKNPTRYFQLGMLLSSEGSYQEAVDVFEAAVILDPQYANARYLLALAYVEMGRYEDALVELQQVAVTNPENQQLNDLIKKIEAGDLDSIPSLGLDAPVSEVSPEVGFVDTETGRRSGDTDLISPVNTISTQDSDNEEVKQSGAVEESEDSSGQETES